MFNHHPIVRLAMATEAQRAAHPPITQDELLRPRRIQLQRTKGWRLKDCNSRLANGLPVVVVTRPGPWGNYAGNTRKDFEDDLARMSNADRAFFMDKVKQLRGHNLACWCPLDRPCHADVLLELANKGEGQ